MKYGKNEMKSHFYRILTISLSFGVISGCDMPSVINLFSNNTATASGSVQVNVDKGGSGTAATGSVDSDKLDKIVGKLDEIASKSANVSQKPKEKSYKRLVDGILETTGFGDGLFGGLSASGSVRAFVHKQAIDTSGRLILWMTAGASAGAHIFRQSSEDVTESSYEPRNEVREESFFVDVTGTASPAVQIDLTEVATIDLKVGKSGRRFVLDPRQNVLGLASFPLITSWKPSAQEVTATARMVAFGTRTALLYLAGPASDKGWYHWDNPKEQPPLPHQDWGAMSTKFVDDPVDSVVYIPATGGATVAWFSITTTTGKQSLVDEKYAQSVR